MSLETANLVLRPCAPAEILILIEEPERFEELAGLRAADRLPEMFSGGEVSPSWLEDLRKAAAPDPWRHGFFAVHREAHVVIGTVGFKGPPDSQGAVEIAYGIAPAFQGRGYATEVARALAELALGTPCVGLVRAHTLRAAGASTRVLAKCGFELVGTVVDPDDGAVWRWERGR